LTHDDSLRRMVIREQSDERTAPVWRITTLAPDKGAEQERRRSVRRERSTRKDTYEMVSTMQSVATAITQMGKEIQRTLDRKETTTEEEEEEDGEDEPEEDTAAKGRERKVKANAEAKGKPRAGTKRQGPRPIVMIDLGNVHDVLPAIEHHLDTVQVYAFADYGYTGRGVNPPAKKGVYVFQSKTRDKNAADVRLICEIWGLVCTTTVRLDLFVATKDNGFLCLKDMVEEKGHTLTFVKDWAELAQRLALD
jgi:hypothetical protein